MSIIKANINLKSLNTFGIDVKARFYLNITNKEDLFNGFKFITYNKLTSDLILVLGGGSNILFTKDFEGIVLHINTKGIKEKQENENKILVKAEAGEEWENLITHCINKQLWGLENLSYIPGKVGSSPIQNIGAYGVEIKETFEELEAYEIISGNKKIFKFADCKFGYRNSIFKSEYKNKFIIWSVTYKLSKNPSPNLTYKALYQELIKNNIINPSLYDIHNAIIKIRKQKLPDPKHIGNAGSFFKNPIIPIEKLKLLLKDFPDIVYFTNKESDTAKIAAAWLIEKCGWKGKNLGRAAVYSQQPLVIINKGGAKGEEILELANKIIDDVKKTFEIKLEPEVNIL
ncbi:MAG TPA: UDP-N-acetylmuramate dehydrogenase, partial [Bacteroidales bacterium]|nr:UDP-N-acetylmuramate dehydrogenase [Bacteroidales bacterium]